MHDSLRLRSNFGCRSVLPPHPSSFATLDCFAMVFTPEQKATFEALYHEASAVGDDLKIVQVVDKMLELLIASGEAQIKNIAVTRVVPHKANRAGSLMDIRKIYSKGSKIMGVGFSLARCDHKRAVAFQVKPGDDRDVRAFVDMAKASPHLATFDSTAIEACSVGCGHLNQFLAAVVAECQVPDNFEGHTDLFGAQGGTKLDKHLLCKQQDTPFATTLDIGLKWTFIPYKFEEQFPQLPHFIQKALNSDHHIAEGETWDEQFRGLASAIVDHFKQKKKTAIDYPKIARAILASKPPRAADVPSQLDFCQKWGGGNSQSFVFDICDFVKISSGTSIVAASTFEAIDRLKMPGDNLCPYFIAAVVKCAASRGPARGGVSIHITEADIKGLLKVLPQVQEANSYMERAATIVKEFGADRSKNIARGKMECDMVEYVLKKMPKANIDKLSLAQISRRVKHSWHTSRPLQTSSATKSPIVFTNTTTIICFII